MEYLLTLVAAWWWLIVAIPFLALVLLIIVAYTGSDGPEPKLQIFEMEKSFLDVQNGIFLQFVHFVLLHKLKSL